MLGRCARMAQKTPGSGDTSVSAAHSQFDVAPFSAEADPTSPPIKRRMRDASGAPQKPCAPSSRSFAVSPRPTRMTPRSRSGSGFCPPPSWRSRQCNGLHEMRSTQVRKTKRARTCVRAHICLKQRQQLMQSNRLPHATACNFIFFAFFLMGSAVLSLGRTAHARQSGISHFFSNGQWPPSVLPCQGCSYRRPRCLGPKTHVVPRCSAESPEGEGKERGAQDTLATCRPPGRKLQPSAVNHKLQSQFFSKTTPRWREEPSSISCSHPASGGGRPSNLASVEQCGRRSAANWKTRCEKTRSRRLMALRSRLRDLRQPLGKRPPCQESASTHRPCLPVPGCFCSYVPTCVWQSNAMYQQWLQTSKPHRPQEVWPI